MKDSILGKTLILITLGTIFSGNANSQTIQEGKKRQIFNTPYKFPGELVGEHGFIAVPENRAKSDSRTILVYYLRFFSRSKNARKSPVFVLPAGPGEPYSASRIEREFSATDRYSKVQEILEFTKSRDVIVINQRGNNNAPGLNCREMVVFSESGKFEKTHPIARRRENLSRGFLNATKQWRERGIDLSGYGIISLVNDVEDLRVSLGYKKICLRGGSFGSQECLAYMASFPGNVERALLHAVEPVDYEVDSADDIWKVLQRVETMAKADRRVKLPDVGLLGAIKAITERLEKSPVTVMGEHPRRKNFKRRVVIGPDDFRSYLLNSRIGRGPRERLAYLPKFVTEIYQKDYRYLAARVIDDRPESYEGALNSFVINGSLGISDQRRKKLKTEAAQRWLGSLGWRTDAVAKHRIAPSLPAELQRFKKLEIPVLMIQGDLDLSTPYENAVEQAKYLPNSHLIRVRGGTHATTFDAADALPKFPKFMYDFMDCPTDKTALQKFYAGLPREIKTEPLKFKTGTVSLFDEVIQRRDR